MSHVIVTKCNKDIFTKASYSLAYSEYISVILLVCYCLSK